MCIVNISISSAFFEADLIIHFLGINTKEISVFNLKMRVILFLALKWIFPSYLPLKRRIMISTSEKADKILFAMYPNDGKWYSRTISSTLGSFEDRKSFPDKWAGLRDEEFSQAANIPDGVFCHHSCFICGSYSHESTVKLVEQAIQA